MDGAQSQLQMDLMSGDKMGGAQFQLQMSGRTNNVMRLIWAGEIILWVGREECFGQINVAVFEGGTWQIECGLCWVGFGWSLEESESKNSVSAITNHIKIKSPWLYIW